MTRPHVPIRASYAALLAGVVALALYATSLGNGFAFDDAAIIGADERVHSLAHLPEIFTQGYWRDDDQGLYRPLTTLTYALDWSLAPDQPAWFHLVNVLLHGAATVLATLLLARFFPPFGALAGGVLFAVHPVHVEAVANVVGRGELLAAIAFLGACLAWTYGGEGRTRILRTVATPVLFALAVFSKESAIMLPAVLPLLDVARGELRRATAAEWLMREAKPYAALALIAVAYLLARAAVLGEAGGPERLDPSLEVLRGIRERTMTALTAWPVYARLLFFPRTLLADYGPRITAPATSFTPDVALGALLLLGTVIGGFTSLAVGRGRAALALLWFPITILPVSNLLIPIGVLVAERTLYLPSLALCFGAAALVQAVARRSADGTEEAGDRTAEVAVSGTQRTSRTNVAVAVALAVAVILGARTLARIPDWQSTDTIMAALVRDRPDAFRGHWHSARLARFAGDNARALELYGRALELWPYRARLVLETIGLATRVGDLAYADRLSQFAVDQWPDNVDAWRYLAAVTLDRGDTASARRYLLDGLRVAPEDSTMLRMRDALGFTTSAGTSSR